MICYDLFFRRVIRDRGFNTYSISFFIGPNALLDDAEFSHAKFLVNNYGFGWDDVFTGNF